MAVEPQVQQFIDFIRDEMPRRIKTNPNNLPDAQKLLVSVSGTLEVIYKTLAELDIAIKSDVDTELSNKEPSITAGSNTQYWRGDKTFQTLNTDAVPETVSRVYLNPAQKTIATQAASSTVNGYLSSADWSTFNGKQNTLTDVITANTYGNSTQYPVITFNAKGIATAVTLQTVPLPTFTDANFSVQKDGSPSITASWSLTALTASHVHTYPNKDIDFRALSSIGAADSNNLSGTRARILGGRNNTVSGTDCITIGGSFNAVTGSRSILINCTAGITNNDVIALNARSPNASNLEANSILLGTSTQTDLFKNLGTAAALRLNALYALSSAIPISGTLYATIDGSQTLSASNLVLGVNDTGACAAHEVEFIVCVGAADTFGGILPTGYFIAKRRIVVFRHAPSGTFYVSAVQTIGTDVTLATLGGTITPDLSIDTTIGSATIHRLLCKIDRTGGVAGQEVVAMSVRVTSHHSH